MVIITLRINQLSNQRGVRSNCLNSFSDVLPNLSGPICGKKTKTRFIIEISLPACMPYYYQFVVILFCIKFRIQSSPSRSERLFYREWWAGELFDWGVLQRPICFYKGINNFKYFLFRTFF